MIFPTGTNTDLQQWRDDALIECHNDDALWGFAVRAYEGVQLRTENQWDDLVFLRLMQMGCHERAPEESGRAEGSKGRMVESGR